MKINNLIILILMLFCSKVSADPVTKLLDTHLLNEVHVKTLNNGSREFMVQKFPWLSSIRLDDDFKPGKYYWYDIDIKSCLTFKILTPDEIIWEINDGYATSYYKTDTLLIECYPYILSIDSYSFSRNEIKFNVHRVRTNEGRYDLIEKVPSLDDNEWNKETAKLIIDGDYFKFYISDTYIQTFCRLNEETINEYDSLIKNTTCDYSKVTWPRHADGSCDYDDKIIVPDPLVTEEDIKALIEKQNEQFKKPEIVYIDVKSIKKTVINQKFEMFAEPGGYGIGIFQPGAEVKVKKIGPEEVIDNVKSNWVKITIVKNGKTVILNNNINDYTGWVFGGCLK